MTRWKNYSWTKLTLNGSEFPLSSPAGRKNKMCIKNTNGPLLCHQVHMHNRRTCMFLNATSQVAYDHLYIKLQAQQSPNPAFSILTHRHLHPVQSERQAVPQPQFCIICWHVRTERLKHRELYSLGDLQEGAFKLATVTSPSDSKKVSPSSVFHHHSSQVGFATPFSH